MINHNNKVFSIEDLSVPKLSTNDVLLQPRVGILSSRTEVIFDKSFIYSSPMDVVTGLNMSQAMLNSNQNPVFCRFLPLDKKTQALKTFHSNPNFWYSVGSRIEDLELIEYLFSTNQLPSDAYFNISVDVAHGATQDLLGIYNLYRSRSWCRALMSGTVATPEAAAYVFSNGKACTHIRVGIGPGSACSTRIVTGCGYPNLSAVYEIYTYMKESYSDKNFSIIADGGIKTTGDIAKYLSAGADGVMLGNMLSSLKESEGWIYPLFGKPYKYYRGQASAAFQKARRGKINGVPEGVQSKNKIYITKSFSTFEKETRSAIASTISYLGLKQISDLKPENVDFIKITQNGFNESRPHLN